MHHRKQRETCDVEKGDAAPPRIVHIESNRSAARRRARRRRSRPFPAVWSQRLRLAQLVVLMSIAVMFTVQFFMRKHASSSTLPYAALYDKLYAEKGDGAAMTAWRNFWLARNGSRHPISDRYGPRVEACSISVVMLDPRLGNDPNYGPGQAGWFALESAASNLPSNACFVLLTSSCGDDGLRNMTAHDARKEMVEKLVAAAVLPVMNERFVQQGRVRVSLIDHTKYGLHRCGDYGKNPTPALLHHRFWQDEFVEQDADTVLFLQDDAVLCRPLPVSHYAKFALVGAVWPPRPTALAPFPREGYCAGMAIRWKTFIAPQLRWQRHHHGKQQAAAAVETDHTPPFAVLPTDFPDLCHGGELAPAGQGGLSIRSRSWMMRAIATCPHVQHSGLPVSKLTLACEVWDDINEDLYFAVVLHGLRAPMPSASIASMFAVEALWPEQVRAIYNIVTPTQTNTRTEQQLPRVQVADQQWLTVPVGLHKPWWYQPNDVLLSSAMSAACPFLQYVFDASMSRYSENAA